MPDKKPIIFSLIEMPEFPKVAHLYEPLGFDEQPFYSSRKLINKLKKTKPDIIVAQFHYLYGSDYASCHLSNLDSVIATLQKYSDYQPKLVLFALKQDLKFIEKLTEHYQGFAQSIDAIQLPLRNVDAYKDLLKSYL